MNQDALGTLATDAANAASDLMKDAKHRANGASSQAADAVENAYSQVQARVRRGADVMETSVQSQPLAFMLAAGLAGAALAWLMARR